MKLADPPQILIRVLTSYSHDILFLKTPSVKLFLWYAQKPTTRSTLAHALNYNCSQKEFEHPEWTVTSKRRYMVACTDILWKYKFHSDLMNFEGIGSGIKPFSRESLMESPRKRQWETFYARRVVVGRWSQVSSKREEIAIQCKNVEEVTTVKDKPHFARS